MGSNRCVAEVVGDLHDVVVHRLSSAGLLLAGAAQLSERPEAIDRIQRSIDELDAAVREIQTIALNLQRPPSPEA